jgi:hypothetical protein
VNSWLRTLWICWLALALPVQGFAAAQMLQCGPAHARMHVAVSTVHEHTHDHAHHGAATAHHDDTSPDPSSALAKHSCSACAACCVGLALPSSAPLLTTPTEAAIRDTGAGAPEPVFLTSGLERPPRPALA